MRNKLKITKEMENIIISMYENGDKISDIEKAIGHSDKIIYDVLKKNNIERNRNRITFTKEQIDNIISLHNNHFSYTQIADIYNCSGWKIYQTLQDLGVLNSFDLDGINNKIESFIGDKKRKYYFDEHIFDVINTADKAYCIGLFMADGCNYSNNNMFSIELQARDKPILDKIKIMFQSDYPLYFRDHNKTKNIAQDTYKFSVTSEYFCDRLAKLGVVPQKSLILKYQDMIDKKLMPYLIKGYIDGDGWVQQYQIGFMSTLDFCEGVKNYLSNEINVKSTIVNLKNSYNENTKVLIVSGRNNIMPLSEIMFSKGNLYLERKYEKYKKFGFINNINESLLV